MAALEEEACALARKADVILLCIGLDEISESEGLNRPHMRIPESQSRLPVRYLVSIKGT